MKYFLSIMILMVFVFSCKKQKSVKEDVIKEIVVKPQMAVVINHKKPKGLTSASKNELETWKAYNEFNKFLERFENISPNEALSNATELKELIRNLQNDLYETQRHKIEEFNTNAFRARINVLENEILRLNDMNTISSITAKEVNQQVDKIFLLFSSFNAKINTIFVKRSIPDDIMLEHK